MRDRKRYVPYLNEELRHVLALVALQLDNLSCRAGAVCQAVLCLIRSALDTRKRARKAQPQLLFRF